MNENYPYYEIKEFVDNFCLKYSDLLDQQGWTIESRICDKCEQKFDMKIRETDERYFFITSNGKKIINKDFIFIKKLPNCKNMRNVNKFLNNNGFIFDKDGLILNVKKNDE